MQSSLANNTATPEAITVAQLNQRLSNAIAATPGLRNIWVTGETSDLRVSGGHCYFELLQKDDNGNTIAKIRANVWAQQWRRIAADFAAVTGYAPSSGMKILACVTASYHPAYGMSVTVSAIDASFTLGDAVRRRNEIVRRLTAEGILDLNRQVRWTMPPQRVAIISARGAAGYGDFINQLYTNPYRIAYTTRLYPAVMQGERTVPSVMEALESIAADSALYDCVVIIRGGGATSDLAAFDDYTLAAAVARFPIPVVVGIGHERDITVLDYVANMRVKTPTAAAEWIIARGKRMLDALDNAARKVSEAAMAHIEGNRRQLAVIRASLPGIVGGVLAYERQRQARLSVELSGLLGRQIAPRRSRLDAIAASLGTVLDNTLSRHRERLDTGATAMAQSLDAAIRRQHERLDATALLLDALSPDKILRRGFSITYAGGHAVRSIADVADGTTITTRVADGMIISTVAGKQSINHQP